MEDINQTNKLWGIDLNDEKFRKTLMNLTQEAHNKIFDVTDTEVSINPDFEEIIASKIRNNLKSDDSIESFSEETKFAELVNNILYDETFRSLFGLRQLTDTNKHNMKKKQKKSRPDIIDEEDTEMKEKRRLKNESFKHAKEQLVIKLQNANEILSSTQLIEIEPVVYKPQLEKQHNEPVLIIYCDMCKNVITENNVIVKCKKKCINNYDIDCWNKIKYNNVAKCGSIWCKEYSTKWIYKNKMHKLNYPKIDSSEINYELSSTEPIPIPIIFKKSEENVNSKKIVDSCSYSHRKEDVSSYEGLSNDYKQLKIIKKEKEHYKNLQKNNRSRGIHLDILQPQSKRTNKKRNINIKDQADNQRFKIDTSADQWPSLSNEPKVEILNQRPSLSEEAKIKPSNDKKEELNKPPIEVNINNATTETFKLTTTLDDWSDFFISLQGQLNIKKIDVNITIHDDIPLNLAGKFDFIDPKQQKLKYQKIETFSNDGMAKLENKVISSQIDDKNDIDKNIKSNDDVPNIDSNDMIADTEPSGNVTDTESNDDLKDTELSGNVTDTESNDDLKDIKSNDNDKNIKSNDDLKDIEPNDNDKNIKLNDFGSNDIITNTESNDNDKNIKLNDDDMLTKDDVPDIDKFNIKSNDIDSNDIIVGIVGIESKVDKINITSKDDAIDVTDSQIPKIITKNTNHCIDGSSLNHHTNRNVPNDNNNITKITTAKVNQNYYLTKYQHNKFNHFSQYSNICNKCQSNYINTRNYPCGHVTHCSYCILNNKMCYTCYGTIVKYDIYNYQL